MYYDNYIKKLAPKNTNKKLHMEAYSSDIN